MCYIATTLRNHLFLFLIYTQVSSDIEIYQNPFFLG